MVPIEVTENQSTLHVHYILGRSSSTRTCITLPYNVKDDGKSKRNT